MPNRAENMDFIINFLQTFTFEGDNKLKEMIADIFTGDLSKRDDEFVCHIAEQVRIVLDIKENIAQSGAD